MDYSYIYNYLSNLGYGYLINDLEDENYCSKLNLDIFYGFQDITPMNITVIAELIANVLAVNLPTSILNAYGNWLQMIGQVISMYVSQQVYYEAGTGRYFSVDNKNVDNYLCKNRCTKKYNRKKINEKIDFLQKEIEELKRELSLLRNKM